MNKEIIKNASNLFDSNEKWSSFHELTKMKNDISTSWFKTLSRGVHKRFQQEKRQDWAYTNWGLWDHKWYLEEFGGNSIGIWMWGGQIGLSNFCSQGEGDFDKAKKVASSNKYSELLAVFRADVSNNESFLALEKGNFKFDTDCDFSSDDNYADISWYAGNKTEEFITQISEKVNTIRDSEYLISLLRDLNQDFISG